MDRRNFFTAGAVATAAAGLATVGATGSAKASATGLTTIYDFGAKGDGSSDDGPAFNAALQWAAQNMRQVLVPGAVYAIKTPISWSSQGNVTSLWGLEGLGAQLLSRVPAGADVMKLSSNNTVRYLKISGISIVGNNADANGLHLFAPGSAFFNNCIIDAITVEQVGGSGLFFEGNVFESTVAHSSFQDNGNGATFAHSQGGVCSAIDVVNCYMNQNNQYGLQATIIGAQYGGTTDVRVYGGYYRQNKSYGMYYNNGSGTTAIINVGFENNCTSLQPGNTNGAHIYSLGGIKLRNCAGYNEFGGATYLLRGWFDYITTLDECAQSAGGAMAAAGPARLIQVFGPNTGVVLMRTCAGQVDVQSGNATPWIAQNCQGASPSGLMTMVNTLTGD